MNGGNGGAEGAETLIFTCAGAAYSGQVSNQAGVKAAQAGSGNLFCTAAVGAAIPDKLDRARKAGRRVVVDGCDAHCARKILEGAGLAVDLHVDVTAHGVEKSPAEPRMVLDAKRIAEVVAGAL